MFDISFQSFITNYLLQEEGDMSGESKITWKREETERGKK